MYPDLREMYPETAMYPGALDTQGDSQVDGGPGGVRLAAVAAERVARYCQELLHAAVRQTDRVVTMFSV